MPVTTPLPAPVHPLAATLPQSAAEKLSEQGAAAPGSTEIPSPGTDGTQTPPPSGAGNLWMIVAIVGVVWFLIFMPERKAKKQREEMLGGIKKGDKVVTTGGLHGQVVDVRENEVVLKAGDVRLTFSRTSVHQVLGGDAE